jgi:hypothetical protein
MINIGLVSLKKIITVIDQFIFNNLIALNSLLSKHLLNTIFRFLLTGYPAWIHLNVEKQKLLISSFYLYITKDV